MTKSVLIVLLVGVSLPSLGNTVIVSSTTDSGAGTLREQITAATSGDTINFTVNGFITLTNEIALTGKNLTIAGPGATNLTITTGGKFRAFNIVNSQVTISGLTFSNCASTSAVVETGGAIEIDNFTSGGGSNMASIVGCAFINNRSGWGGAVDVFNGGLAMSGCTFVSNLCTGIAFGTYGGGGALSLGVTLPSTIANCTFSGNRQIGTNALQVGGGAIYNFGAVPTNPPPVTLEHCTFVANVDVAGPAGAMKGNQSTSYRTLAKLRNCLLVNNQAPAGSPLNFGTTTNSSIAASYVSLGGNVTDENTSSTNFMLGVGDKVSNAIVATTVYALAYNGGSTKTHAIARGSPAQGNATASSQDYDQRGAPRHIPSDAGAYELIEPEISVAMDGSTIDSDGEIDFGSTPIGAPLTRSITISNSQMSTFVYGPLMFSGLSIPSGYTSSGFSPSTLSNGQSTSFTVTLSALSPGLATGLLSIASNDGFNPEIHPGDPASEVPFVANLAGLVTDTVDLWRKRYFGPAAENDGNAADDSAPAGDGMPNLLKYALGLDPWAHYSSGVNPMTDIMPGGYLRMTVNKNPAATDVALSIEVSGDLVDAGNWTDAETIVDEDSSTTLQAHDKTAGTPSQSRFIRLSVSHP